MPIYPYSCKDCGFDFEIAKQLANIDFNENCPECRGDSRRNISKYAAFYGASDWDSDKIDPAFGVRVTGSAHRKRLAKERGWTEVGNEDVNKLADIADKDLTKKLDESWDGIKV